MLMTHKSVYDNHHTIQNKQHDWTTWRCTDHTQMRAYTTQILTVMNLENDGLDKNERNDSLNLTHHPYLQTTPY